MEIDEPTKVTRLANYLRLGMGAPDVNVMIMGSKALGNKSIPCSTL